MAEETGHALTAFYHGALQEIDEIAPTALNHADNGTRGGTKNGCDPQIRGFDPLHLQRV
jgi:hypothetical protein